MFSYFSICYNSKWSTKFKFVGLRHKQRIQIWIKRNWERERKREREKDGDREKRKKIKKETKIEKETEIEIETEIEREKERELWREKKQEEEKRKRRGSEGVKETKSRDYEVEMSKVLL